MTNKADPRYCPAACPFLQVQVGQGAHIPYYCKLFSVYLAYQDGVLRCADCLGSHQKVAVEEEGFGLINATAAKPVQRMGTKWAFHRFSKQSQRMFVGYLKQFGKSIPMPKSVEKTQPQQMSKLEKTLVSKMTQKNVKPQEGPDRQEIKDWLVAKAGDAVLDGRTSQLIENLFLVMDATERSMFKAIIGNPKMFETFLEKLKTMARNDTLLQNVRRELDELYDVQEIEQQTLEELMRRRQNMQGNGLS